MYQLAMLIGLTVTYEWAQQNIYNGVTRDSSATYTRARHIRVLEQRGVITLRKA